MNNLESVYSDNAKKTYERLYLARDSKGNIVETIKQCHGRVADFLADSEVEYLEFKRLLDDQKFRPNTPCLSNAGIRKNPMMLACHVEELDDDMDSISNMINDSINIFKDGGGIGIPITNLRRENGFLSNGGQASGIMSFLGLEDKTAEVVRSGGRVRRAAVMAVGKYNHPDIEKFINCKRDKKSFKHMNLSVSADDDFMRAIKANDTDAILNKIDPNEGVLDETVNTHDIWDQILQAAWEAGDPGLLFLDTINQDNPLRNKLGDIECTNPCSEVALWPSTSCCLGHINVNAYSIFNWEEFKEDIYWSTLFLNKIIEKTSFPNEKFKEMMHKTKPIGLGLMGFADLLYKRGIRYGSHEAIELLDNLTQQLTKNAFMSSAKLANEGKITRNIDICGDELNNFMKWVRKYAEDVDNAPANITTTCLAPTGSTALSADCSFSFEPQFALVWNKNLDGGGTMEFLNEYFKQALRDQGYIKERLSALKDELKQNKGSVQNIDEIPQELKDIFVTAHDIPTEERLQMQAAAQQNITMAVSSTVNLPNSATKQDIGNVYVRAWELGLKGITVFRDGCLGDQPVDFGGNKEEKSENIDDKSNEVIKEMKTEEKASFNISPFGKNYHRPKERNGKVVEVNTPAGKMYIRGSFDQGRLMEVFIDLGSQGQRENVICNGLGRVISRSLQRGVEIEDITDTLRGAGGDVFFMQLEGYKKSFQMNGILDAVATVLDEKFKGEHIEDYIQTIEGANWESADTEKIEHEMKKRVAQNIRYETADNWYAKHHEPQESEQHERCPVCSKFTLRKDVGCRGGICVSCGYSACEE